MLERRGIVDEGDVGQRGQSARANGRTGSDDVHSSTGVPAMCQGVRERA
jgi:hypothetical protein